MNFFEHQDQARRNTVQLLLLFALALSSMIAIVYLAVVFTVMTSHTTGSLLPLWDPGLFFTVASAVLATVGFGSLWKIQALKAGGAAIALDLGGQLVTVETQDPNEQRLLNVVEEMAIASGISVPQVYVLQHEAGINAFAAGFSPNQAVVAVTRGCLDNLTRDELQGVIAHEFSHILNGDMRLNIRLIGVLNGILVLYIIGRVLLRSSGSSRRGKNQGGFAILGLTLVAVGLIGVFFGRLIKAAVSRQREFLADASAVQFTRDPSGLSSALSKINQLSTGSRVMSPAAEEASHMFFSNALANGLFSFDWFATHPPLAIRIKRLGVVGQFQAIATTQPSGIETVVNQASIAQSEAAVMGLGGTVTPPVAAVATAANGITAAGSASGSATVQVSATQVVNQVGTVDPEHLAYVQQTMAKMPEELRQALRHPHGAIAVVYGLLLDPDSEDVRQKQLALLEQNEPEDIVNAVRQFQSLILNLNPRLRLPLLDLTIPAIRTISTKQCGRVFNTIKALVRADGRLSLSEYVLQIVLQRRLMPYFKPEQNNRGQVEYTQVEQIWSDCVTVLTGLARVGHSKTEDAAYALRSGLFCLPNAATQELPQTPPNCSIYDIGNSLNQLEKAAPKLKQAIVDACAHTVMVDNTVTIQEAELLRAIVIALDCPLPPFLEKAA
ncbi:MAG: M48 family metallopeptidase [Thainema sp.]